MNAAKESVGKLVVTHHCRQDEDGPGFEWEPLDDSIKIRLVRMGTHIRATAPDTSPTALKLVGDAMRRFKIGLEASPPPWYEFPVIENGNWVSTRSYSHTYSSTATINTAIASFRTHLKELETMDPVKLVAVKNLALLRDTVNITNNLKENLLAVAGAQRAIVKKQQYEAEIKELRKDNQAIRKELLDVTARLDGAAPPNISVETSTSSSTTCSPGTRG